MAFMDYSKLLLTLRNYSWLDDFKDDLSGDLVGSNFVRNFLDGVQTAIKKLITKKITSKDIIFFTRQFATMLSAGIPITDALSAVATGEADNSPMQEMILRIESVIATGKTLTEALKLESPYFGSVYLALTRAGETGGFLDEALNSLATYLERNDKVKRQILSALIYPCCVIFSAMGVTLLLLLYVIPTFAEMFQEANMNLPALTQAVINVSNLLLHNSGFLLFLVVACIVAGYKASKNEYVLDYLSRAVFRIPILGKVILQLLLIRFSRVLSALISAGIPIVEALSISGAVVSNRELEKEILNIRHGVENGESFSQQIAKSCYFPPLAYQFCHVGESTGTLDGMLAKIASFYEEETSRFFANSKQLLEPTIILVLGVIVGTLVVAMYLPILQLGQLV